MKAQVYVYSHAEYGSTDFSGKVVVPLNATGDYIVVAVAKDPTAAYPPGEAGAVREEG